MVLPDNKPSDLIQFENTIQFNTTSSSSCGVLPPTMDQEAILSNSNTTVANTFLLILGIMLFCAKLWPFSVSNTPHWIRCP
mmetsp:Transcript_21958/g.46318  ORF Transcript_21958/g.46318 Transcript_21958/m.46318 type:complete len:81 (+) Transcript_21958:80-322(+)